MGSILFSIKLTTPTVANNQVLYFKRLIFICTFLKYTLFCAVKVSLTFYNQNQISWSLSPSEHFVANFKILPHVYEIQPLIGTGCNDIMPPVLGIKGKCQAGIGGGLPGNQKVNEWPTKISKLLFNTRVNVTVFVKASLTYIVCTVSWGSWYDHVKGYWVEREKKNILYLFYEDMKEVRRIYGPIKHGPNI